MAIRRKQLDISCLEAARIRVKQAYKPGLNVYVSISGGKDSIVLTDIIYKMILKGEIPADKTIFIFIDEEAMFDDVIDIVKDWRKKLMMVGAKFDWYCMEYKHYNCLNTLSEDESFICWDRYKKDVWVRQKPKFAITDHPLFNPRKESYQTFLKRLEKDGVSLNGLRCSESLMRLQAVARKKKDSQHIKIYPIYDFKDSDIWKYILDNKLDFPEVYMKLWQTGTSKPRLRISQFFSIDTARVLSNLYEFYPDLADRVNKREPNAYLVQLYWDTEMFRRSSKTRRQIEKEDNRDYKKLTLDLLSDISGNFKTKNERNVARQYRKSLMLRAEYINEKQWKRIYGALIAGDPKLRTLRSLISQARLNYVSEGEKERARLTKTN